MPGMLLHLSQAVQFNQNAGTDIVCQAQIRITSMKCQFRWNSAVLGGCAVVLFAITSHADDTRPLVHSSAARLSESFDQANWLNVNFESSSIEQNDFPYWHDHCPPGSALLFSGFDGVIFFKPWASFVYMY